MKLKDLKFKAYLLFTIFLIVSCQSKHPENHDEVSLSASPIKVPANFREARWQMDPRAVLTRSDENGFDSHVVGDPCIVWDEEIHTWRMFYFAMGRAEDGEELLSTGMAKSKSAEEIGPGDWEKLGQVEISNPEDFTYEIGWHKWWVIMDAYKPNRAAKIEEKYWSVFTCTTPNEQGGKNKFIQVAFANRLAGPWTVVKQPVLSPDENWFDGLHCDTPTAYWVKDENKVAIFYKAYPKYAQQEQKESEFGSGTVLAWWHPSRAEAEKVKILQRPGQSKAWNQGWMSTPQVFYDKHNKQWYGLINGSPTSPADESHREPAPSLGGWVISGPEGLESLWSPDTVNSPFRYPEDLNQAELDGGIGVNFWRHHLLATPGGKARIFFNSGQYGTEQMYSMEMQSFDR
ncbi:hypothetical protein FNH22_01560 [Fulvivirga sp. M361]|uniref:hypothetical protein n=1 Tax=Fulvivirga sp. M361 TaxID=2594266 RepID=UPI00117B67A3|nr:hypothetical protein [Fulvivirga sp. M361]TRX62037.1 hypothetical protein FNH22_01560 [Fulvivirga sp. M361]